MKIAYIASRPIPSREANSIHVMKMCQAIGQEGHVITLLSPLQTMKVGPSDINEVFHHYGIRDRFEILWTGDSIFTWGFPVSAIKWASKSGVDLIYTRSIRTAVIATVYGHKVIFELHGPPAGRWAPSYFRTIYRSKNTLGIVVISHALKKEIYRLYPRIGNRVKVIVASDGIDLERFSIQSNLNGVRSQLGYSDTDFVIGYAGHLYKGRGLELIYGLAEYMKRDSFLIIGGEQADIDKWERRRNVMGLSNVRLLGFMPNAILPEYLRACDVLIMPYQNKISVKGLGDTSKWCSPMKMFEYMASGKLIISSDLPVLREVLTNGSNALLCPPNDPEKWIDAISLVRDNETLRRYIALQALSDVAAYSWRGRVKRILSCLAE